MAKKKAKGAPEYSYRYRVTVCPSCGADLVKPESIRLITSNKAGEQEHRTCLDKHGRLQDVEDLVANGYHSATDCLCDHGLWPYEEQFKGQEPPVPDRAPFRMTMDSLLRLYAFPPGEHSEIAKKAARHVIEECFDTLVRGEEVDFQAMMEVVLTKASEVAIAWAAAMEAKFKKES